MFWMRTKRNTQKSLTRRIWIQTESQTKHLTGTASKTSWVDSPQVSWLLQLYQRVRGGQLWQKILATQKWCTRGTKVAWTRAMTSTSSTRAWSKLRNRTPRALEQQTSHFENWCLPTAAACSLLGSTKMAAREHRYSLPKQTLSKLRRTWYSRRCPLTAEALSNCLHHSVN